MEYEFAFDISTSVRLGKHCGFMLRGEQITLGLGNNRPE